MLYYGKQWNTYNRDEVIDDIFDEKHINSIKILIQKRLPTKMEIDI